MKISVKTRKQRTAAEISCGRCNAFRVGRVRFKKEVGDVRLVVCGACNSYWHRPNPNSDKWRSISDSEADKLSYAPMQV